MKKAILFIGLGDLNTPFIDDARDLGFKILCTNKNPESLALKKADEGLISDGKDLVSILNFVFLKKHNYKIECVYAGSELFVTKEAVSLALGLPYNSLETALAGENKVFCRSYFKKNKTSIPKGNVVSNLRSAMRVAKKLKYPVIVKPSNRLASLGVQIAISEKGLEKAYTFARKFSDQVIIEQFLEGTLHDVNGFFHNGKFYKCGISDKKPSQPPYVFVEELSCPSILSKKQKRGLYNLLSRSAKAIGVEHGPVKADVILTEKGFKLMEIALRFHGPLGSVYCLPNGERVKPFEYYLSVLSGKKYQRTKSNNKYVFIKSINPGVGTILKYQGLDKARRIKGVSDILILKKVGERLEVAKSNFDLFGYVVIYGKDKEIALKTYSRFVKVFKVVLK